MFWTWRGMRSCVTRWYNPSKVVSHYAEKSTLIRSWFIQDYTVKTCTRCCVVNSYRFEDKAVENSIKTRVVKMLKSKNSSHPVERIRFLPRRLWTKFRNRTVNVYFRGDSPKLIRRYKEIYLSKLAEKESRFGKIYLRLTTFWCPALRYLDSLSGIYPRSRVSQTS